MKNITKNANGTYTIILHLKEEERKSIKRLAKTMNLTSITTIMKDM